ncbi:hypothetical protein ACLB1N_00510 [Escherichia coli]
MLDTACSRVAVSQSTRPDAIQDIEAKLERLQETCTAGTGKIKCTASEISCK